jgi:hypothetical protein
MSEARKKLGKHVRLLPDFYINNLIPQADWEGEIVEVRESLAGQTTTYKVQCGDEVVIAKDEELEEC